MKEFKRWKRKQDIGYARKSCCTNAIAVGMEQGWRAALEWELSTILKTKHGTLANSIQRSVIEKELNDKPEE